MSRAEEFRDLQKELLKDRGIGAVELQAVYLGQIADILASIADCLEQRESRIECIATLKSIQELGDCNTCGVKDCQYRPEWGKPVRYNCPHYEAKHE